jgi:hypothetical protein
MLLDVYDVGQLKGWAMEAMPTASTVAPSGRYADSLSLVKINTASTIFADLYLDRFAQHLAPIDSPLTTLKVSVDRPTLESLIGRSAVERLWQLPQRWLRGANCGPSADNEPRVDAFVRKYAANARPFIRFLYANDFPSSPRLLGATSSGRPSLTPLFGVFRLILGLLSISPQLRALFGFDKA